jgi:hypothetical protein
VVVSDVIPQADCEAVKMFLEGENEAVREKIREKTGVCLDEQSGEAIAAFLSEQEESLDDATKVLLTGHYPTDVRLDPLLSRVYRADRLATLLRTLLEASSPHGCWRCCRKSQTCSWTRIVGKSGGTGTVIRSHSHPTPSQEPRLSRPWPRPLRGWF